MSGQFPTEPDITRSKPWHDRIKQDQYHDEQNHEAEVHGYCTYPEGSDVATQEFQWRISRRVDGLGDHQDDPRGAQDRAKVCTQPKIILPMSTTR